MVSFQVNYSVYEGARRVPLTLENDLNGEASLEDFLKFTKASLILITDQVFQEEKAKGFDRKPLVVVDGRSNKPIENVHPLGQIELIARMPFADILLAAYEGLLHRSKVVSGRYISSHYVFLNGKQVATSLSSLQNWLNSNPDFKDEDIVRIVNITPYGRRLELLGVTAQRQQNRRSTITKGSKKKNTLRTLQIRRPNGAYQLTARSLKSKFGKNVDIRFTFLSGSAMGLIGPGLSFKNGRAGKNSAGRAYLYPTLIFKISERGLL